LAIQTEFASCKFDGGLWTNHQILDHASGDLGFGSVLEVQLRQDTIVIEVLNPAT
jgi:hypothetical protein